MLTFKEKIAKNYINAVGWSTKQKYLLIESDDWGAIRMPSKNVYERLIQNNIEVNKFSFDRNDSLESEEDLKALFKTLQKFEDKEGNNPVITAYYVVANPDFERIEASKRKEYHYETILETYQRAAHTQKVPALIKDGMQKGIFIPQSHGREHIQVKRWMEAINSNSKKEQIAFKNRAIISSKSSTCSQPYIKNYFAGQDYSDESEHTELETINAEALDLFEQIFGFKSISFVAQGGVWGDHLLKTLFDKGVRLIGGQQLYPNGEAKHKTVNKFWGSQNQFGQLHWRRNCMFEPARNQNFDWIGKCLQEIEIAFRWGKPAVISAHRENFIGSIFEENRTTSLKKTEELIASVLKKWPDVKFISTHQLAEIMNSSLKN
jgi:hypothetical protein